MELPVQVNGKLRGSITIATGAGEQEAVYAARQDATVAKYLEGMAVRKIVYVQDRMLNIVVASE
jgi:leucyl-tRNA synthetase